MPAIQHIMLPNKDSIINHRDIPQRKLHRVPRNARPVALQPRVNALLRNGEDPARDVEEDLPDGPPPRRLVPVVGDDLRRELDERDDELHVRDGVRHVQRAPPARVLGGRGEGNDERDEGHAEEAAQREAQDGLAGAGGGDAEGPGGEEVLGGRDEGEDEGVEGEEDVVGLDGGSEVVVAEGVLRADGGGVGEGAV